MLIDIDKMQIIRDDNDKQICFIEGKIGGQYSGGSFSSTLVDFSDGILRVYKQFEYHSSIRNVRGFVFGSIPPCEIGDDNLLEAVDRLSPINDGGSVEVMAVDGLGWLFKAVKELQGNITTKGGYFDDKSISTEDSYRKIGFMYEVVEVLKKYFSTYLDRNCDNLDFIGNINFVFMYAQMPWLDHVFKDSQPFETNTLNNFGCNDTLKSEDNHILLPFVTKDLNTGIDNFFKKYDVKTNKRLKRIIFSNLVVVTKRKNVVPRSLVEKGVHLKYKAETLIETVHSNNGTHDELIYERRTLKDFILYHVILLCKIFPIDLACDILEEVLKIKNPLSAERLSNNRYILDFLRLFSLCKQKRFIMEELGISYSGKPGNVRMVGNYLIDTARMYNDFNTSDSIPKKLKDKYPNGLQVPKKFKGIKELHDKISVVHNEIKMCADNKAISYDIEELLLDGLKDEDIELQLAHETSTVTLWGKLLKHCIAGYGQRAVDKKIMLLAVVVNDELKYNIELIFHNKNGNKPIRNKTFEYVVRQFRGLSNCKPDPTHNRVVHRILNAWIDELNSSDSDRTDQSMQLSPLQEQLRERIHGAYFSEARSENGPSLLSNENPQNKNQDQQATQDVG